MTNQSPAVGYIILSRRWDKEAASYPVTYFEGSGHFYGDAWEHFQAVVKKYTDPNVTQFCQEVCALSVVDGEIIHQAEIEEEQRMNGRRAWALQVTSRQKLTDDLDRIIYPGGFID